MNVMNEYYISPYTDVYRNIAVERYLTQSVGQGVTRLYLWQNADAVVIGKNQNSYAECDAQALLSDGGRLARRFSGGGAVFHDLGNLNFSFIECKQSYNQRKHYEVIQKAVADFGICAQVSGRNDITADGKKFSGNAFFEAGGNRCHHGTLLIRTNRDKISKYLTVSKDKLVSKGVKSVSSRVVNLSELSDNVTLEGLGGALIMAFENVYGCWAQMIEGSALDVQAIGEIEKYISGDDWIFSPRVECEYKAKNRFPWGGIEIGFTLSQKKMTGVSVFSDAMDAEFILGVRKALENAEYSPEGVRAALSALSGEEEIKQDIGRTVYEKL